MNKQIQSIFIALFSLVFFVSNISAQLGLKNAGKLKVWTDELVQRQHGKDGCLSKIRVAKNKGFDRMVFEYKGGLNSYSFYFLPSDLNAEGEKIRIAGKVFMNIDLYGHPCKSTDYPEGKLKLPMLQEITGGLFEGDVQLTVGLSADNLYRVQELKNPARLVIDFKH
jgi:hypothetical protein